MKLGRPRMSRETIAALARIRGWTRERFALPETAVVLATEVPETLPGFPPVSTIVAFWIDPAQRSHYQVFKPAIEVAQDDLPPAFLKNSLAGEPIFGCPCC
jgi:nitrate reductase delta subunit